MTLETQSALQPIREMANALRAAMSRFTKEIGLNGAGAVACGGCD